MDPSSCWGVKWSGSSVSGGVSRSSNALPGNPGNYIKKVEHVGIWWEDAAWEIQCDRLCHGASSPGSAMIWSDWGTEADLLLNVIHIHFKKYYSHLWHFLLLGNRGFMLFSFMKQHENSCIDHSTKFNKRKLYTYTLE